MDPAAIAPGQPVALYRSEDEVRLVRVPEADETVKIPGLGVISADLFEGVAFGDQLQLGRRSAHVLQPTPELVFQALERRAQVIGTQDAARIVHACGIGPGSTVVEGGLGSGALTATLAYAVGQTGRVHGFDVRQDHLEVARRNLAAAGLLGRVETVNAGLEEAEVSCQAFVADVPDPVSVLPGVLASLVPGGRACFYTPTVEQMEDIVRELEAGPFLRVRCFEQLERGWVVHDRGARPDFEMLGHTGFLTVATRVADR